MQEISRYPALNRTRLPWWQSSICSQWETGLRPLQYLPYRDSLWFLCSNTAYNTALGDSSSWKSRQLSKMGHHSLTYPHINIQYSSKERKCQKVIGCTFAEHWLGDHHCHSASRTSIMIMWKSTGLMTFRHRCSQFTPFTNFLCHHTDNKVWINAISIRPLWFMQPLDLQQ